MKTLLLSITTLFLGLMSYAQNCDADYNVSNIGNSYTFVFTGNQPTNASITWNIGGQIYTGSSVTTTLASPSMDYVGCQVTLVDSVNNLYCTDLKTDTLYISGATNSYCLADFDIIQDSTNLNDYYVVNQSLTTSSLQYLIWDFGDGTSTNDPYPSHNYANVGTYVISLFIYTDSCWSIATDTLVVSSKSTGTWVHVVDPATLTVQEFEMFSDIHLYPNPVTGENVRFNFVSETTSPMEIKIYTVTGNMVLQENHEAHRGSNQLQLGTSNLSKGLYYLIISGKKGYQQTLRLVVN